MLRNGWIIWKFYYFIYILSEWTTKITPILTSPTSRFSAIRLPIKGTSLKIRDICLPPRTIPLKVTSLVISGPYRQPPPPPAYNPYNAPPNQGFIPNQGTTVLSKVKDSFPVEVWCAQFVVVRLIISLARCLEEWLGSGVSVCLFSLEYVAAFLSVWTVVRTLNWCVWFVNA